jgi:transcriptional regulator GlxA family with amidase domain
LEEARPGGAAVAGMTTGTETSRTAPRSFLLVLLDGFSLLSVAAVIDPLRSANRVLGAPAYRHAVVTAGGRPARASSGISIEADHALPQAPKVDLVLVCAGLFTEADGTGEIVKDLRRRAREGTAIGGVSTGARILGRAGLLDGYRCTIHWEARAAFAEACPAATVTDAPFEIDRDRYTTAGGTASIDMMLHLIARAHGQAVCREVANQFQHERIRSNADRQRSATEPDLTGKPPAVATVIRLMAANLERPLSSQELADAVQLSVRQVERLFLRHVGATPTNSYIALRLARARELLRQTNASVLDVALATGFTSQSHFAQTYRAHFGVNPSDERRAGHS